MKKKNFKRITVKLGTRVLTSLDDKIDHGVISDIVDQVSYLMANNVDVIIVSSGAIASGRGILNIKSSHKSLSELQAMASVGQNHLMNIYNGYFNKKNYNTGQILLTQDDFNSRKRFLNIRYTINTLLKYKTVPIINENDSVSTDEIKWGDNDRLSYLVSDLANSEALIILTDVDGLYDKDGQVISNVEKVTPHIKALCSDNTRKISSGGMTSKVDVAKNASEAGINSVIANGKRKNVIIDIINGLDIGTSFAAKSNKINSRKRWIAYSIKPKGALVVDNGAETAIKVNKKSLLAAGITAVSGNFSDGDVVNVVSCLNKVIARGLVNYSSIEMEKIKGLKTEKIEKVLGYKDYDEVIHRDNLTIIEE